MSQPPGSLRASGGPKGFIFVKHVPSLILHQFRDISKKSFFDPVFTLPGPKTGLFFFGTCLLVGLISPAWERNSKKVKHTKVARGLKD